MNWHRLLQVFFVPTLLTSLINQPLYACGGDPPQPSCGKTITLTPAVPQTLLLPGGGTFNVAVLIYFNLVDWPPGSGICPGGPFTTDIDISAVCTPGPDGSGLAASISIPLGYSTVDVPVTLPAGPPRECQLTVTATSTLSDGMVVSNGTQQTVCVAEPAPGNPLVPRLQVTSVSEFDLLGVHPGSQGRFAYRVTNNDPSDTFTGQATISSEQTSRRPTASGPMPPRTGVYAPADPFQGDNFPVGFAANLDSNGCIPLPPDPQNPQIPIEIEPLTLAPGASALIPVFSRSWGMCADGSCSKGLFRVDGVFDDLSNGLGCASYAFAADPQAPPSYLWPGSGQALQLQPLDPFLPLIIARGNPLPATPTEIQIEILPLQLTSNGVPLLTVKQQPLALELPNLHNTHFRLGYNTLSSGPLGPSDAIYGLVFQANILPPAPPLDNLADLIDFAPIPGVPSGGADQFTPFALGRVNVPPADNFQVDSFFDIFYQISLNGQDDTGEQRNFVINNFTITPEPTNNRFIVDIQGQFEPGPGLFINGIESFHDFRGFASSTEMIFTDGFESGNISVWSRGASGRVP